MSNIIEKTIYNSSYKITDGFTVKDFMYRVNRDLINNMAITLIILKNENSEMTIMNRVQFYNNIEKIYGDKFEEGKLIKNTYNLLMDGISNIVISKYDLDYNDFKKFLADDMSFMFEEKALINMTNEGYSYFNLMRLLEV